MDAADRARLGCLFPGVLKALALAEAHLALRRELFQIEERHLATGKYVRAYSRAVAREMMAAQALALALQDLGALPETTAL